MNRLYTIIFLVLINLAVFGQTITFDFVDYDDQVYILNNPHLQEGLTTESFKWGLTTGYFVSWHPVTWWSFLVDVSLFGMNPAGYHAMNVLLHILATIFLFYALFRMSDRYWESLIVAVLFAIHPQHVQSVAWISERKDVLSALFMGLTIIVYHRYTRDQHWLWYSLTVAMFILGLMSKSMLVTLPCVLFLLDYWPLNRLTDKKAIQRAILEKIPLMLLAIGTAIITYIVQDEGGAVSHISTYALEGRVVNALTSYSIYLYRTIWPFNLSFFYPLDFDQIAWAKGILSAIFLIIVSGISVSYRLKAPQLLVGWLWYLGTLIPVIGLVRVGIQANADRYTYIPLIGVFIAVVFTLHPWLFAIESRKRITKMAYVILCVSMILLSYKEASFWKNTALISGRAVTTTEDNHVAYYLIGNIHLEYKTYEHAELFYQKGLELDHTFYDLRTNMGILLEKIERLDEAEAFTLETVSLYPKDAKVLYALARIAQAQGDENKTNNYYLKHANLLWQQGDLDKALQVYNTIIAQHPNFVIAYHNKASALVVHEHFREAKAVLEQALKIDPTYAPSKELLHAIQSEIEEF